MISRQQGVVIGMGVVLGIACVGAGVFLTFAILKNQEKKTQLDEARSELENLYRAKIFPNDENIKQMQEDQKTLGGWLEAATNRLAEGGVPLEDLSPALFKSKLTGDIREMAKQSCPTGVQARVGADFMFGFDKYKEAVLPVKEDVPRLNQQLEMIKLIVTELNEAGIAKLDAVAREVFEDGSGLAKTEAAPTPKKNKNRPLPSDSEGAAPVGDAQQAMMSPALANLFSRQRFSVVFLAHPDTLADVLNRLSAMSMLTVVSDVEIKKTAESITRVADAAKPAARDGAKPEEQPAEPAAAAASQIVTNPEDEPPVNVRLNLDVYSFKGV